MRAFAVRLVLLSLALHSGFAAADSACAAPEPAAFACGKPGDPCRDLDDCCGMSFCHSGRCAVASGECSEVGGFCEFDDECCGSALCNKTHFVCVKPD